MRNILLLASLLCSLLVYGQGDPLTTTRGQGIGTGNPTQKRVSPNLLVPYQQTVLTRAGTALLETGNTNMLFNGGCEDTRTPTLAGWTSSIPLLKTNNESLIGDFACEMDLASTAGTTSNGIDVSMYTLLAGTQGYAEVHLNAAATGTVSVFVDGVRQVSTPIQPSDSWKLYPMPFIFGSSTASVVIEKSSAGRLLIDNTQLGVAGNLKQQVDAVGEWIAYTPTFTGFGTVTNVDCRYKLITDSAIIQCKWTNGTVTAVEARASLPIHNGVQLLTKSGVATSPAGAMATSNTTADNNFPLYQAGLSYLTFSRSNAGSFSSANANSSFNNGETMGFIATVPVSNSPFTSSIYSAPAPQAAQIKFNNAANCTPNTNSTSWTTLNDTDCNSTTLLGGAMVPTVAGDLGLRVALQPGKYNVYFAGQLESSAGSTFCRFSLFDGTSRYAISPTKWVESGGLDEALDSSEEIIEITTATVRDFVIQAIASSGSANCRAILNNSYADANVRIGIEPISSTITGRFENVVTTPGVSAPKIFSAEVSSTGVVTNEKGDFINGDCNMATTGQPLCLFNAGVFLSKPNCSIELLQAGNAIRFKMLDPTTSATQFRARMFDGGNVYTNYDFSLSCHGE